MDFPSHIVITGASGGIGSALAKAYSKKGVHLFLFGRKKPELEAVAKECRQLLADVSIYTVDVTQIEELQKTLNEIDVAHPVDLVIANAGITNYLTSDYNEESWFDTKKLLDVNVIGAFATVSSLITKMRQRKHGQIALVSSMAAYYGLPISPAYSASKAALKAYGEALRGLLCKEGVKISVIFPGFVKSNMSDQFLCAKPFLMTADKAAQIIKRGLEKNKARIAFPLLLHIGMKFLSVLPCFISNFILLKSGYCVKN
ncbi:MAG: SDR family NAD(P)-dependent oxidoreductase [Gammaproteobacteria bacterium]|nr:SDR family NAD(P)-dependent oxidoreductase [Gammaproteobacteria bacterium]